MTFRLPFQVLRALNALETAGFSAYVVGGCVRDWALGVPPHDFDICTSASPAEMQRIFRREKTIETGIRHGTLTVLLDGMPLEITTFRLDGEYLDGRHPESVRFTSRVEDDLSRRDFTINAMAYSPAAGLIDPFKGKEDCEKGVVRCVGDARQRFSEDALRILRALRFSARLGFPIEENTAAALRQGRAMLQKISRERIAAELSGLLLGKDAGQVLAAYPEVLVTVLPETEKLTNSAAWHTALRRIGLAPKEEELRWAALLMDAAEDGEACADLARDMLKSLKMSNRMITAVSQLLLWKNAALRPDGLQEMLVHLGQERLCQLIRLQAADSMARAEDDAQESIASSRDALLMQTDRLVSSNACYTLGQLAVDGRDMAGLGLRGARIGQALEGLLLRVARGELPNRRDALLAAAAKHPENGDETPCGS